MKWRRMVLGQVSSALGLCAGFVWHAHRGLAIGIAAVGAAWIMWREIFFPRERR